MKDFIRIAWVVPELIWIVINRSVAGYDVILSYQSGDAVHTIGTYGLSGGVLIVARVKILVSKLTTNANGAPPARCQESQPCNSELRPSSGDDLKCIANTKDP